MATIDLGRIKFKWQGAWSSSTSYVVDDVVESGGNAYVCIAASTNNVPPNATYWELMAQKGTDTSVATTQGDIIYHNGTSLARLGAGTAGEALITNGTGANPSWGSAGGIKQVEYGESATEFQQSSPSNTVRYYPTSNKISATITPSSTSSKILVQAISTLRAEDNASDVAVGLVIKESISGGSTTEIMGNTAAHYASGLYFGTNITSNYRVRLVEFALRSPNTTNAITYEVGVFGYDIASYIKLNDQSSTGRIIAMEVTV